MTPTGSNPTFRSVQRPQSYSEASAGTRSRLKECERLTPEAAEVYVLQTRARFLTKMLFLVRTSTPGNPYFDVPLTVAVATAVDDDGCNHKLISQSSSNRLDHRLEKLKMADEEFIGGTYHAERNIALAYPHYSWLKGQPIAATRAMCDLCLQAIALRGMRPVGRVFVGELVEVGRD